MNELLFIGGIIFARVPAGECIGEGLLTPRGGVLVGVIGASSYSSASACIT